MRTRDIVPAHYESRQIIGIHVRFDDWTEKAEFPAMPRKQLHHPEHHR
jgi:hypothetical protein